MVIVSVQTWDDSPISEDEIEAAKKLILIDGGMLTLEDSRGITQFITKRSDKGLTLKQLTRCLRR